jgi:hypothetical protein
MTMVEQDQKTAFDPITDEDRQTFHDQGYLYIRNALTPDHVDELVETADRVYAEDVASGRIAQGDTLHRLGITTHDIAFTRLIDHGPTFRYVWGFLGWNIYTQHSHLDVNPPRDESADTPKWGWHQDGWRQNSDAEFHPGLYGAEIPRPLFSLKVAFVLSDLSEPDRGQTLMLPGSHHRNSLPRPSDPSKGFDHPAGYEQMLANPGDAMVFDRRLWHSRSPNHSQVTRKMVFISYTWRWIRPVDNVVINEDTEWWASLNPVQRQLMGEATHDVQGYWGVREGGGVDDRIPLRAELKRRNLLDRSVPWLR